jgi:hypothetical protein
VRIYLKIFGRDLNRHKGQSISPFLFYLVPRLSSYEGILSIPQPQFRSPTVQLFLRDQGQENESIALDSKVHYLQNDKSSNVQVRIWQNSISSLRQNHQKSHGMANMDTKCQLFDHDFELFQFVRSKTLY